jgi:hypothetical protein
MITNFEIVGPYLAALMMSLGALCMFIWGVFSGAFVGADEAAMRFYQREVGDVGNPEEQSGERGSPGAGAA